MSDSNTHLNAKDDAQAPPPVLANSPPAEGQARMAQQPKTRAAPGRKPLFRS